MSPQWIEASAVALAGLLAAKLAPSDSVKSEYIVVGSLLGVLVSNWYLRPSTTPTPEES